MEATINKSQVPAGKETASQTPAQYVSTSIDATNKKEQEEVKEKIEEEVKESFKDENVPVEPAIGNDGIEVGGEG